MKVEGKTENPGLTTLEAAFPQFVLVFLKWTAFLLTQKT